MNCTHCQEPLPDVALYCSKCGWPTQVGRGARRDAYAVQPTENVVQLALVSTVMPHTNRVTGNRYRWALAFVVLVVAVFTLTGLLPAAIVSGAAFAVPIVYLLYLYDPECVGGPARRLRRPRDRAHARARRARLARVLRVGVRGPVLRAHRSGREQVRARHVAHRSVPAVRAAPPGDTKAVILRAQFSGFGTTPDSAKSGYEAVTEEYDVMLNGALNSLAKS